MIIPFELLETEGINPCGRGATNKWLCSEVKLIALSAWTPPLISGKCTDERRGPTSENGNMLSRTSLGPTTNKWREVVLRFRVMLSVLHCLVMESKILWPLISGKKIILYLLSSG